MTLVAVTVHHQVITYFHLDIQKQALEKVLLTFYMLNFSEETKTYIYILCHSSTLTSNTKLKFSLK